MKTHILPTLVTALLAAPPAFAGEDAAYWRSWAQDFSHELRHELGTMFATRMGGGKVVKGAPYSAELVTETNQMLADGNVISKRKTGAVYRDGDGRTRQETGAEGKERTVFINDPVANTHFVLTPGSKRATATAPRAMSFRQDNKQVVRVGPTEVRVEDGKVFIDGKEVKGSARIELDRSGKPLTIKSDRGVSSDKVSVFSGDNITINGKPLGEGPGNRHVIVRRVQGEDGRQHEEMEVTVIRGGDDKEIHLPVPPVPPTPPTPPAVPAPLLPGINTMRFESTARLGKGVTTSLGMKDFDGVKAEGKSTTWTIPAGQIGNKNAINVMHETWYAPDLQVTVYSRHSDPRTGESVYRLASIRRGEPSPELFKVPEDYKMKSRAPKG